MDLQDENQDYPMEEDYGLVLQKAKTAAIAQKNWMKALISNEGYKFVQSEIQKQIDGRMHYVLEMPQNSDDVVKRTYTAGEIAGMKIVQNYAQILLDAAQNAIDLAKSSEFEINEGE